MLGAALDVENTVTPDGVTVIPVEIENALKVIVVMPTLEQVFPAVPFPLVHDSRVTVCVVLDNAGRVAWEKTAGTIRRKNARCLSNPELLILKAALVETRVEGSGNEDELEIVVRDTMVEVKDFCSGLDDVEVDEIEVV